MLKQRILTALILGPALIALVLIAPTPLVASVFGVLILIGTWEWSQIAFDNELISYKLGYAGVMALAMLTVTYMPDQTLLYFCTSIIWWIAAFVIIFVYQRSGGTINWGHKLKSVGCFFILLPSWAMLVDLHELDNGNLLLLLLFIIIWAADSGAYFVGRWKGKTKLANHISPGKTVEGLAGGLAMAAVAALISFYWLNLQHNLLILTLVGICTAAMSVLGDLVESYYKRLAGIKDSGTIFPGHGGVLDRIDSLTAAAPIYVGGLYLAGVTV